MNRVVAVVAFARRISSRSSFLVAVAFAVVNASLAPHAAAAHASAAKNDDIFNVSVGAVVAHDSNLFRTSDSLGPRQSDNIGTAYARLQLDKPYSRQRFRANVTGTTYHYEQFSYLNFEGLDYGAEWNWNLTSQLSGTLSANRTQSPTRFEDTSGNQSNVVTRENYGLNLDYWPYGGWHALLGASRRLRNSEQSSVQPEPDYRESRGEVGVRYLFPTDSSITAIRRAIDGGQDNQVLSSATNNGYRQDDTEITGRWIVSSKSVLTGRLTHLDRSYDQNSQRNFSGTAVAFRYDWKPTEKLSLDLFATRTNEPYLTFASVYRVRNVLSVTPSWHASAKVTVYMGLQRTDDKFPTSPLAPGVPERSDSTNRTVVGVDWSPRLNMSLNASLQRETRSSNDPSFELSATVARIGASFTF